MIYPFNILVFLKNFIFMIQRIQTIYLFLASVALALMMYFPIYQFDKISNGTEYTRVKIMINGTYEKAEAALEYTNINFQMPQFLMSVCIGLALLVCIFLYKNRKQQLRIARILIILEFSLMLFIFAMIAKEIKALEISNIEYGIGAFLPSLAILLTALAARAIRKDETLVRSADRLR